MKVPTDLTLRPGENIEWYGMRSWRSYSFWLLFVFLWIFLGLAFPVLLLLGIALLIIIVTNRYNSEYAITDRRVYSRYGFSFGGGSNEILLGDIYKVKLSRNIFGRSMNYGDIVIDILGDTEVVFKGVDEPERMVSYLKNKSR